MTSVGLTPCRSLATEDIRDLQPFPGHGRPGYQAFFFLRLTGSSSKGLLTAFSVRLSTWL